MSVSNNWCSSKGLYFSKDYSITSNVLLTICVYSIKVCLCHFMHLFIVSVSCFTVPLINYVAACKCFDRSKEQWDGTS